MFMFSGSLVRCVTDVGCAVGRNNLMLDSLSVCYLSRSFGASSLSPHKAMGPLCENWLPRSRNNLELIQMLMRNQSGHNSRVGHGCGPNAVHEPTVCAGGPLPLRVDEAAGGREWIFDGRFERRSSAEFLPSFLPTLARVLNLKEGPRRALGPFLLFRV